MAKPAKGKPTGPVRSKRRANTKRGNSPKTSGKIFGNPHNCSMPKPKGVK